jgi:hypothetical protein
MVDTAQVGSEKRPRTILPLPAYGADNTGLVCGFLFAPGTAGRHLSSPEAIAWLRNPRDADDPEFAWLHFDLAGNATEKWLCEHLTLPDAFHEALHRARGRPASNTRMVARRRHHDVLSISPSGASDPVASVGLHRDQRPPQSPSTTACAMVRRARRSAGLRDRST